MVHRLEIPLIHIFRIQSQSLTGDCFILLMYPTFSDDAYSLSFQLTNIIWGEADDSDDHIVPYPEASEDYCKKKESSEEASTIKSSEQKAPGAKADTDGRKLESISNVDTSEGTSSLGLDMDRWPNLSSPNA